MLIFHEPACSCRIGVSVGNSLPFHGAMTNLPLLSLQMKTVMCHGMSSVTRVMLTLSMKNGVQCETLKSLAGSKSQNNEQYITHEEAHKPRCLWAFVFRAIKTRSESVIVLYNDHGVRKVIKP